MKYSSIRTENIFYFFKLIFLI